MLHPSWKMNKMRAFQSGNERKNVECHPYIYIYILLDGATSTSLPYLAGLPLSMGFQKGGGICVSERCGICYISDGCVVSGPCLAVVYGVPLLLVGGVAEAIESETECVDVSLVGVRL